MHKIRFGIMIAIGTMLASVAAAQRNPVYLSIEAELNGAPFVGVGAVSDVGDSFELEISEVIKGIKTQKVLLKPDGQPISKMFPGWKTKHTRLLLVISKSFDPKEPVEYWRVMLLDPREYDGIYVGTGYFSMDFGFLKTDQDVLRVAREYEKSFPETCPTFSLCYIPETIRKQFPYNTGGEVIVPVNRRLEEIATKMIQHPKSFIPSIDRLHNVNKEDYLKLLPYDEGTLRRIGVSALAKFKSNKNIGILKGCLNDTFVDAYWGNRQNVYSVRMVAYEALKNWGVSVPSPEFEPPLN